MSTKQIRRVGIVGMGYVGLPLALAFCKAGFRVVGVDVDERRVKALQAGISSIEDVSSEELAEAVEQGRFLPTTDYSLLREVESVSICVPTPLRKSREPDVSYVISAARTLAPHVQKGQTIILESTVYPGATEEVVAPALEGSGLKAGEDFYLAFSPERIDPANHTYALEDIPKLVGGVNQASAEHAAEIYGQVFDEVVLLASAKEAEMAKLLENTFRAVNIGLVNELAIVAHRMGVNLWNVIDAASTKPFGFMPFYPGPGWGGHCIPVDPFYLAWRARQDGFEVGFIEQAGRINTRMPAYVVERVSELLEKEGKPLRGSRIMLLGVAYKRDVGDIRESPALTIAEDLDAKGVELTYHDPHVACFSRQGKTWRSQPLSEGVLQAQDLILILTDHGSVDYDFVAKHSALVFDTRNVMASLREPHPNVSVL